MGKKQTGIIAPPAEKQRLFEKHVVRDVLHGYIPFDSLDRDLIDCPVVQRLRWIRQNDVAFFVYPSLNTSRFEHSLGVFHLAGVIARAALKNARPETREDYLARMTALLRSRGVEDKEPEQVFEKAAKWYGLLHDIGHLPFSHLAEYCLQSRGVEPYRSTSFSKLHETAGEYFVKKDPSLIKALNRDPAVGTLVTALMTSKKVSDPILQPLKDIVDSDVDADRIDATARDGRQSGGDYGHYDIARLCRDAVLYDVGGKDYRIVFTTRATSAIESLLAERVNTHRWIHFQHKVVTFKNAFRHAFENLELDPKDWHAKRYVTHDGLLDDAALLQKISSSHWVVPTACYAAQAVTRRARTARSLWKRRDEFTRLSENVSDSSHQLKEYQKETGHLALNRLWEMGHNEFEGVLNDNLPARWKNRLRFLCFGTRIKPFESSRLSQTVGVFNVLTHYDSRIVPLTGESKLVEALMQVVEGEPAVGVTVVGQPTLLGQLPDLQAFFVSQAKDYAHAIIA